MSRPEGLPYQPQVECMRLRARHSPTTAFELHQGSLLAVPPAHGDRYDMSFFAHSSGCLSLFHRTTSCLASTRTSTREACDA